MTDETPSPTTRMPVPEPASGGATGGWPGSTVPEDAPETDASAPPRTLPPPAPSDPPSIAPVAAVPRRDDRDRGRTASILFGLVILGLGLWFFAEHTLGLELPRVRWSQMWPAFLVVIGLWVVLGELRRGSR